MLEVTRLSDGRTLVEGTDSRGTQGATILQSDSWDAVLKARRQVEAMQEFDQAVEAFFAPLTAVADRLAEEDSNELTSVTIGEDVEGHVARRIELDPEGVVLRVLAETDGSTLRWVPEFGGQTLVVVAS